MIDYYKELIKKYHPDLNKGCKACSSITKVVNKLKKQNKQRAKSGYKPFNVSDRIIQTRNCGVVHQFHNDIGGCSANYR